MIEGLSSFPFNHLCATSLADPFLAFPATQVPGCLPWRYIVSPRNIKSFSPAS